MPHDEGREWSLSHENAPMTLRSVRFVILEHNHPYVHWDFMFEEGDSLRSWRLLNEPALDAWIEAERLPNHRKAYLDYEGPVSGDRGEVVRWKFGSCQVREFQNERICLTLNGSRWEVDMTLVRITADSEEWRVRLSPKNR